MMMEMITVVIITIMNVPGSVAKAAPHELPLKYRSTCHEDVRMFKAMMLGNDVTRKMS